MAENTNDQSLAALNNLRTRLLDLTARNRLLNFRHTKTASLRIIDELPDQLVETLLQEEEMRFLPVPEPDKERLISFGYLEIDPETSQERPLRKDPTAEEWARLLGLETSYEVPTASQGEKDEKHTDLAIQTLLFPFELEKRLRDLRQKAVTAIEETGANILYISFGFLEWFESNDSSNTRIAPLYLLPVSLQKGKLNKDTGTYEYRLSYTGEDILTNLSLREKLRFDFNLALPDLDENTSPEEYLRLVEKLIQDNQPRWKVRRFISLGLVNFSKLLMYLDLDPARWPAGASITDHPTVNLFLSGYDGTERKDDHEHDLNFGEEYCIDDLPDIHDTYPLIDDADSSQHSALIDALDGKNLVIEGPPGTGKSQTITNLIAAAIAQGKKVLFVAEKLAALEVVKRRLDAAGLGDFCLELHSHKAQKRKILDDIQNRIVKRNSYKSPKDIIADIARYEDLKRTLKSHVERVNQEWKNTGKTISDIFMAAARYRSLININPDLVHPSGYDGEQFDAHLQRRAYDEVSAYGGVYQSIAQLLGEGKSLTSHPWYGVGNADLQIFDVERVLEALSAWQVSLTILSSAKADFAQKLRCNEDDIPDDTHGLNDLLAALIKIPMPKGNELFHYLPRLRDNNAAKLKRYLDIFEEMQSRYQDLSTKVIPTILNDLSGVDALISKNQSLSGLVAEGLSLSSLADCVKRLDNTHRQLTKIEDPVRQTKKALGQGAEPHLGIHQKGLTEFKWIAEIVIALKPEYWKLRSSDFDNDELDRIIPEIRGRLETLNAQQQEVEKLFNIDLLADSTSLGKLQSTLEAGGILHWLKKDWRGARKSLLSMRSTPAVDFKSLESNLAMALSYTQKKEQFETDATYQTSLRHHFTGLTTDMEAIDALRKWFKSVRVSYGIGFGDKVALGEALLKLPYEIARAIRSLHDKGIITYIDHTLRELALLKGVFVRTEALIKGDVDLLGSTNILLSLKDKLETALQSFDGVFSDDKISVSEISNRIKSLEALSSSAAQWNKDDLDNVLFEGALGLAAGPGADNRIALERAYQTLSLAEGLDTDGLHPLLEDLIYHFPEAESFATINKLKQQMSTIVTPAIDCGKAFIDLVKLDRSAWLDPDSESFDKLIERNERALSNNQSLLNWLDYVRSRERLDEIGLESIVRTVEQGQVAVECVKEAYFAGIYDLLARQILRDEPSLSRFSGRGQEEFQRQFISYDNKLKQLQCERIAWKIDGRQVPRGHSGGKVSDYTELSLLEHECGKKSRNIPIRQLVKRAGNALSALKPCFMLGPMSVAQYLEPGQLKFDIVVMDEASQIKPEDALGSVGRGAQLIVVGDPKQLPPTSFFDKILDNEEEDATAIEESESILDATSSIFPARRLRWHYRSQHESLIAFSNYSFYGGDLVLFPSPYNKSMHYGIQFSRIRHGTFVNRRNLEEATIIAEAVREHFRSNDDETIGVVAMSADQREQIEAAIEALAKDDPIFQEQLESDQFNQESLFVKNLENVQGDERDVIYISMTYGPQEPGGNVYQRFGPINTDLGWRRLNVLFTRSRKRMHIFSSMGSDDILVQPSSKRGVRALHNFLAYAETGILHHTDSDTGRAPDSDFEIAVSNALRNAGFECVPQVGVAGFFIDIAVKDPGNPARFLMGIECDGATYHSGKSVRDRDRLRQSILERLGWTIRRVWSTDWFKNPSAELTPIIDELNRLKTTYVPQPEVAEIHRISEIVEEYEIEEDEIASIVSESTDLRTQLEEFNQEVIKKAFPETPESKRLLRPAMLEALLEYTPTNKREFLELIPPYLRQGTLTGEGAYLDQLFELINNSLDTTEDSAARLYTQ